MPSRPVYYQHYECQTAAAPRFFHKNLKIKRHDYSLQRHQNDFTPNPVPERNGHPNCYDANSMVQNSSTGTKFFCLYGGRSLPL